MKSISESLGGTPFIKGAKIMVSENNMGFLDSLLSTDLPEWKANRPQHEQQSKKRKDPVPTPKPTPKPKLSNPSTKRAKKATPGGARRTRKLLYKKHTRRR